EVLRIRSRDDLAQQVLEDGLAQLGDSPELSHSLGLVLVRLGDVTEAIERLRVAADARPENARFSYVYGVSLASAGQRDQAMAVLREALRRHPFEVDLLSALTAYHRDAGEVDSAILYAERLAEVTPDDPNVVQLLAQLRALRP
ncbi:MAG: tetratricopeptide repeat protein, partial [Longimicrobiales bacterium]